MKQLSPIQKVPTHMPLSPARTALRSRTLLITALCMTVGTWQVHHLNAAETTPAITAASLSVSTGSGRRVFWRGEVIDVLVRAPLVTEARAEVTLSSSHGASWIVFTGTLKPVAGSAAIMLRLPTTMLGDDDFTVTLRLGTQIASTTVQVRDGQADSAGMFVDGPTADLPMQRMTWLAPLVRQTTRMDIMTMPLMGVTPYAGSAAPLWQQTVNGFDTMMAGRMLYWIQDSSRPTSFVPPYSAPTTHGEYTRRLLLDSVLYGRFPAYAGQVFDYDPTGYAVDQGKFLTGYWGWNDLVPDVLAYFSQSREALRAEFTAATGLKPPSSSEIMRLGAALGFAEAIGFIDSATERWSVQIAARSLKLGDAELAELKSRCQSWFAYLTGMNKRRYAAYMAAQKPFDPNLAYTTCNTINHCAPRDGGNHPTSYEPLDVRFVQVWDDQAGNPEHIYETALAATLLGAHRRADQPLWVVPHLGYNGSHFRNMMLAVGRGSSAAGCLLEGGTITELEKAGGGASDKIREMAMAGQFIQRLGGAIAQARPVQRVGMLYSERQIAMTPYAQGAIDGWYKIMFVLARAGLTPYPITENMLASGLPGELEAIVVVNQSEALPDAALKGLEAFAARGGSVLMDTQSTVAWPFATRSASLDVPRRDAGHPFNATAPVDRNDASVSELRRLAAERGPKLRALLQPQVSSLALDSVGSEASAMELRGGEATFVAVANDAYLDLAELFSRDEKRRPEYPLIFTEHGYGVLGSWLPLHAELIVGPKVPTGAAIYDTLTRTRVTLEDRLGSRRVSCDLSSIMGRFYAIYPRPVGAGVLSATQRVEAGADVVCRYQVHDAEGKTLAAVVPVELTLSAADGTVRRTLYRATNAQGVLDERIPTSAGDAAGTNSLSVRQQLDGQGVTLPITVAAAKPVQAAVAPLITVRDPQAIRRWLAGKPEILVLVRDEAGKAIAAQAVAAIAKLGGTARIWEKPPTETYTLGYTVHDADQPANARVERGEALGRVQFRNGKEQVNSNIYCSPVPGWRIAKPVLLLGTLADSSNDVVADVAASGLLWNDGATAQVGGALVQWVPQLFGRESDALVVLGADAAGLAAAVQALADLPASDPVVDGVRQARSRRLQSNGIGALQAVEKTLSKAEVTASKSVTLPAAANGERASGLSVNQVQVWNDSLIVDLGRWGNGAAVIDAKGQASVLPLFLSGSVRVGKSLIFAQSGPLTVAYDGSGKPRWKALSELKLVQPGTDIAVVESEKKFFSIAADGIATECAVPAPEAPKTALTPSSLPPSDLGEGTQFRTSSSGKMVLAWRPEHGQDRVQILNVATKQVTSVTHHTLCLRHAVFSADEHSLALGGVDGDVLIVGVDGTRIAAVAAGPAAMPFALPTGGFAIASTDGRLTMTNAAGTIVRSVDLSAITVGANPEQQYRAIRETPLVPLAPVPDALAPEAFSRFFAYVKGEGDDLRKITMGEQKEWQFVWYPVVQGGVSFPQARTYTMTLSGCAKYLDDKPNNQPFWDDILALRAKTVVNDRPAPFFRVLIDGKQVGEIKPHGGVLKPLATTIIDQGFVQWQPKPEEITTFTGTFEAPAGIHLLAIEAVNLEDCVITNKGLK